MRTLLVASQEGGVGTTAAAVNLAAAAAAGGARVLLLDADPRGGAAAALGLTGDPAPDPVAGRGGLWRDAPGGFDAATPYAPGADAEECLTVALSAAKSHAARDYDLVVIDAPPGADGRAEQLLGAADEVVIVERADPASLRSLPRYLEAVRDARRDGSAVRVRGILLTLPRGVPPGGAVEATLRRKFRGLLPQTVPFDPAVAESVAARRPLVCDAPASPAAKQYAALAASLKLIGVPAPAPRRELAAVARGPISRPAPEDEGIFDTPPPVESAPPPPGRTETFYQDHRARPTGRGPDLARSTPRGRARLSPLESAILLGSAAAAVGALGWFCFG